MSGSVEHRDKVGRAVQAALDLIFARDGEFFDTYGEPVPMGWEAMDQETLRAAQDEMKKSMNFSVVQSPGMFVDRCAPVNQCAALLVHDISDIYNYYKGANTHYALALMRLHPNVDEDVGLDSWLRTYLKNLIRTQKPRAGYWKIYRHIKSRLLETAVNCIKFMLNPLPGPRSDGTVAVGAVIPENVWKEPETRRILIYVVVDIINQLPEVMNWARADEDIGEEEWQDLVDKEAKEADAAEVKRAERAALRNAQRALEEEEDLRRHLAVREAAQPTQQERMGWARGQDIPAEVPEGEQYENRPNTKKQRRGGSGSKKRNSKKRNSKKRKSKVKKSKMRKSKIRKSKVKKSKRINYRKKN